MPVRSFVMRPRGKPPTRQDLHRWWWRNDPDTWFNTFGQCDIGEPTCYACGWWGTMFTPWDGVPYRDGEFHGMVRGHLVNHILGGDVSPENLVLLCEDCNREMPFFSPVDRDAAIGWVKVHENWMIRDWAGAERTVAYLAEVGPDAFIASYGLETWEHLPGTAGAILLDAVRTYQEMAGIPSAVGQQSLPF